MRTIAGRLLQVPSVRISGWAGRYLTFAPIITANWETGSDDRWTVPVGLGIGQLIQCGGQPLNLQASAYYNVDAPDNAADWQLRLQRSFSSRNSRQRSKFVVWRWPAGPRP
jgi:hypothetical protein